MTEQGEFMAVQTAEQAKKFIGRRVLSKDGSYSGIREIIGWGEPSSNWDKAQWLTWKEGAGWNSNNEIRLRAGSTRVGDGNWWIVNRYLTFITYEIEIEELYKRKAIIEERIRKVTECYDKDNTVEVKPAIRQLDLDD